MIAYLRPVDYTIAHSLRLLVSITSRCLLPPREKVRLACRERPDSRIAVFGTTECRGKSTSSTRSKRLNMKRETDGAFARYLTLGVFACRGQAASLAISPSAEKHIDRLLRLIAVRAFFVLVLLLLPPSPPLADGLATLHIHRDTHISHRRRCRNLRTKGNECVRRAV